MIVFGRPRAHRGRSRLFRRRGIFPPPSPEPSRAHYRHELDAGGGLPASTTTAPCCRSAAPSSTAICGSPSTASSPNASRPRPPSRSACRCFPVVPYGVTPYFREFPGSISLRVETHLARRARHPRRHGAQRLSPHPDRQRPRRQQRRAAVRARVDRRSSRTAGCSSTTGGTRRARGPRCRRSIRSRRTARGWRTFRGRGCPASSMPATQRPMVDLARVRALDPVALRSYLGDGNFGGLYQRSDEDMLALWQVAVDETRALLDGLVGRRGLSAGDHDAISRLGRGRDRRHAGRVSRARRPRRHAGRHRRRSRRRDRRATASRITGPIDEFTQRGARVHAAIADRRRGTRSSSPRRRTTPRRPRARSLPHLTADGCVISAQNGLNELAIARDRRRRANGRRVRQLRRRLPRARRDPLRRPRRGGRR